MKRICSLALTLVLLFGVTASGADPVSNFFRRLGDTLTNGAKRQQARRAAKAKPHRDRAKQNDSALPDASPQPSPSPNPIVAPTPLPIRRATLAPAVGGGQRDLRYGVPVPNQPGFVRSPWAPNEGFVDVRGLPGGKEVTDPFTGKSFLTP
ncbi:MAG TPA: hypothetical protein VK474_10820 [Chthoniobacterales bacterium]|nr:hypothetical protein [Chthoniobacterales bacterium]